MRPRVARGLMARRRAAAARRRRGRLHGRAARRAGLDRSPRRGQARAPSPRARPFRARAVHRIAAAPAPRRACAAGTWKTACWTAAFAGTTGWLRTAPTWWRSASCSTARCGGRCAVWWNQIGTALVPTAVPELSTAVQGCMHPHSDMRPRLPPVAPQATSNPARWVLAVPESSPVQVRPGCATMQPAVPRNRRHWRRCHNATGGWLAAAVQPRVRAASMRTRSWRKCVLRSPACSAPLPAARSAWRTWRARLWPPSW